MTTTSKPSFTIFPTLQRNYLRQVHDFCGDSAPRLRQRKLPQNTTLKSSRINCPTRGMTRLVITLVWSILGIALLTPAQESRGQTFTVLYPFGITQAPGYNPEPKLIQASDGNFYGACSVGGLQAGTSLAEGTIYKLTPAGQVTPVYTFHGSDGRVPNALVQGKDGNFYGTTQYDGPSGGGTVFTLTPGGTLTTLYRFSLFGVTGGQPMARLIQGSDGNFYGTTLYGGTTDIGTAASGTVFKITPTGERTTLHSFQSNSNDGAAPMAPLLQAKDGNFYGTASAAGVFDNENSGNGIVFKITLGGAYTILHTFRGGFVGQNMDGAEPKSGLVQGRDGNFYGVTSRGGTYDNGTVYKMTPSGTVTILHSFDGNDGATPQGELVEAGDGNFYGVTGPGGGSGTIFKITPQGSLTTLHYFDQVTDGDVPHAGMTLGSDGNLYGTTWVHGPDLEGTAYKLTVNLPPPVVPANISTRLHVDTLNNVAIAGFIITGTQPKKVLVRALGPTLSALGVQGALSDTTLELHNQASTLLASNDDWKIPNAATISATGKAPPNDLESAIVMTLTPGSYTAIVKGKNNTTGVGLVEVYDLDQTVNSSFRNISTRGVVQTGANVMIGGFIIQGDQPQKVIVRALGPTLSQFNVPNVLADPILTLTDANGNAIASNDDWQSSQAGEIQFSGFAPPNPKEPAIIATRPPGNTTAIVTGKNGTIGNALVEVYTLP
jgi:uncharacterized repeat protein (TIGR03803 family)